ncbi:cholinephosphotransferase 1 isoform X4 [Culex pipiens pallens]|uniref:cholinephosphotransferase 1 isoform X4 n=1 Tax=Culex pipiens pallens TaxID=42434 RepID=UPI001953EA05|nr:cholinephosphotransferase 1 isoform X4 [Culex pipiens pallens]
MNFYKNKLLQAGQLKKLGEHKYSCTSVSLLDPILQPWWCWLVARVPLWLAPNLITIVGLAVNILTTLILIYYSPDGRSEPPRWASALCALGLFVYQSLDAIDGKQARRTNSSTPLGELFDHGCDSISTVFVALSACISVQLGFYPRWMFFQCFCAMTLFYCAHWQTYVSGTLRFGKIDVTEAQCTIIAIHLISAVFGPGIWMTKMPLIGLTWNYTVNAFFSLGYLQVFVTFCRTFREGGVGKNGSTVAGTSVLSPIIPFLFVVVPAYVISQKSPDHIYENHPALYIMAFGMITAKVTNRLVVAHMTKSEMEYLDWGLIGPLCLFLNQYFNCFLSEYWVLWFAMLWCTFDLIRYCGQVCLEICAYLKIELFRIPYPPKPLMTSQGTNPQQQHQHHHHHHHHETRNGTSSTNQQQQGQQSQQQANRKQTRASSRKHNSSSQHQ